MADPETVLAGLAAQLRPLIDELAALAPGETTFEGVTGDEATVCRVGLADGAFSNSRAIARRCFSPPDKTKTFACAASSASQSCSSEG